MSGIMADSSILTLDTLGGVPKEAPMQPEPQPVVIYHNPSCGTSRNALAIIRHAGIQPIVVEYLVTPPSRQTLIELISAMGISARELLREKGTPFEELDLANPKWTDEQLIDQMLSHPILMNRPIVTTPIGTRLCRPSERVLELLAKTALGAFTKEDGQIL
jgi:arsenate reductase (glutaredoxin)